MDGPKCKCSERHKAHKSSCQKSAFSLVASEYDTEDEADIELLYKNIYINKNAFSLTRKRGYPSLKITVNKKKNGTAHSSNVWGASH